MPSSSSCSSQRTCSRPSTRQACRSSSVRSAPSSTALRSRWRPSSARPAVLSTSCSRARNPSGCSSTLRGSPRNTPLSWRQTSGGRGTCGSRTWPRASRPTCQWASSPSGPTRIFELRCAELRGAELVLCCRLMALEEGAESRAAPSRFGGKSFLAHPLLRETSEGNLRLQLLRSPNLPPAVHLRCAVIHNPLDSVFCEHGQERVRSPTSVQLHLNYRQGLL
mmetsp:Transcript_2941/g.5935  ORF Transcript_2941/g.5935 Transcript_2941/m.5935 type:complete len:222 (+) Transcript_2941:1184-1849(+)